VLRDLRSDIGFGSMIAALAPHDQADMGGERSFWAFIGRPKDGSIRDGVILSVHAAKA
jgi:hypothetical protein